MKKRGIISVIAVAMFLIFIATATLVYSINEDFQDKLTITNNLDESLDFNVQLNANLEQEVKLNEGPIEKIVFKDLNLDTETTLKIDEIPTETIEEKNFVEVYAIDPTQINFTEATVTLIAKGSSLYKCKEWDFNNRICNGKWILFKNDLIPGQEYSFTLTPEDPAFGEIIAIDAIHLDSNYTFISNIYDKIKAKDDSWAEPINNEEYVRVTFAENLSLGRMIDVFARSNAPSYFEIYEAGTNNFVGRSSIITNPDLQYITVINLTNPTNIFDFKIFDSPLEFDFIHDDVINYSQATGLIVYSTSGVTTPKYRIWNDTYNFTSALNALTVNANIYWTVLKSNHERNESILGILNGNLEVYTQIFNSTGWTNSRRVSRSVPSLSTRAFTIGIEQVSGDVMIFYENNITTSNNQIGYQVWNGTGYSNEVNFSTNLANSPANWIMAFPEQGSDNMMVLIHNNANDLDAQYWNGTGFDPLRNLTLNTGTASNTVTHMNYAWESSSGQGLVTYGVGNNLVYRTFSKTAPYWSVEATISLNPGGGDTLRASRLCADSTSDYIGLIFQDSGDDVLTRMWDGTQILASPPTTDAATLTPGTNNPNIDCAWYKDGTRALFGFVDATSRNISNFTFTKSGNSWSTTTLIGIPKIPFNASNTITGLRFTANPVTNEIMTITEDTANHIHAFRYNGTAFTRISSALETATQVTSGSQEEVMFDWSRYDSVPNVTINHPLAGTLYEPNARINISANATDNINISRVLANITIPNGTIDQITLFQRDTTTNKETYNNTFSNTGVSGIYSILFIVNDTSTFKNINQTITTSFIIQESQIAPNVTLIYPLGNSKFNATNIVNITVNVTDANVTYVFANLTYPNGTKEMLRLYNSSAEDIYNKSYTAPLLLGMYNITFMANDSSNNMNNTLITNFTVYDDLKPNVTNIFPPNNSVYNVGNSLEIGINATDLWGLSRTIAVFVYPNGTLHNLSLFNNTNHVNRFNNSFLIPNETGTYNITFYVNDTNNNLNNSEITNFTVSRVNTLTITALGCKPLIANLSQSVICNATASDEVGISVVKANVTLPDNTIEDRTINNIGNNYYFTFTNTHLNNSYNVKWFANDTDGNNITTTDNFNVIDNIYPNVTLIYPENNLNISSTTVQFNFTTIENYDTILNCSLIIDNITNKTDSNVQNNTLTTFTVSGFTNSTGYVWSIKCKDASWNENISENRTFKIDLDNPRFWLLNATPATEELLDPNVVINLTANVTDDSTYVDSVIFQWKLSNNSEYTNLTSTFENGLYNSSFIAIQNGTYVIRIWSNDSLNHNDYSAQLNISVQLDKNWTRSPSSFNPIYAEINQNVTLGNLTITNNGDIGTNFTITSSSGTVWLNHSATGTEGNSTTNFTLNPGEIINIQVNDSYNIQGIKTTTLTITPNSDWSPEQLYTSGVIVVAPNQPILTSTFTIPATDTYSVKQGDNNVNFKAKLENSGQGNATNVTFSLDIPDDWNLILGTLTKSIDELVSGDSLENNLEVNIPTNATTGTFRIIANATATNYSEANISDFIFGDEVLVTVNKLELGPSAGYPSGGGTTSSPGSSIGGGGGGASKAVQTVQQFDVLRGTSKAVPIKIENIYSNSILQNVKIQLEGFLPQYLKISPDTLNNIPYGSSKNFDLDVFVPTYFDKESFNLKLKVTGDVVAIAPKKDGTYETKPLLIQKTIKLLVREVSTEKAVEYMDKIKEYINELEKAGIPYSKLSKLDEEAQNSLKAYDFETIKSLEEQAKSIKDNAFASKEIIEKLQNDVKNAESKWLKVSETKRSLELALKAYEREDFVTTLARSKDAQLLFILETKGKVNILWLLRYYWWALILGSIASLALIFLIYKKLTVFIINQRIININKEEEAISGLLKEAQKEYLVKKSISESEYNKLNSQYNSRLNRIRNIRVKLRNKRIGIKRLEQSLDNTKKEKLDLVENIKKSQIAYLQKGKISRGDFFRQEEQNKQRLSEIDEEENVIKQKLEKQKLSKEGKLINRINSFLLKFKNKKGKNKGKWINIKIKEPEYKKEIKKTINKDTKKKFKRMSKSELKDWFPGAFK